MIKKAEKYSKIVGKQIGRILKYKGISLNEFSKMIGIDVSVISRYVNGQREPHAPYIALIADALNVDPGVLFKEDYNGEMSVDSIKEKRGDGLKWS